MNTELKALVTVLVTTGSLVIDFVDKKGAAAEMADGEKLFLSVQPAVTNWSDLKAEIAALSVPANQQDLEAFVIAQVAGVPAKAQAIIAATIKAAEVADMYYAALKM